MSDRRLPSFAELPHLVRAQLEGLPVRWREWRTTLRDDPGALWRSPAFRLGAFIALGLLLILALYWVVGALTPGGRERPAQQVTRRASVYVACTNPACRAEYIVKEPASAKDWPLRCATCGQRTLYRATRCPECSHWYAVAPGAPAGCPLCAEKRKPAQAKAPDPSRSGDAGQEDPW